MKDKTGGTAFPGYGNAEPGVSYPGWMSRATPGMTLRQWFAGTIDLNDDEKKRVSAIKDPSAQRKEECSIRFAKADSMLKFEEDEK